MSFRLSLDC